MDSIITNRSKKMSMNDTPFLIKLMPHQRAMVYKMIMLELQIEIENKYNYAMMSDAPGAGKTYALLAFIYIMNRMIYPKKKPQVNIIVVPYNICTQWKKSIESIFGPSGNMIKYLLFTEYSDIMKLYTNTTTLFEYDILLTTSLYFDNIAKTLNSLKLKVKRVIFDEADTISNLLSTELECGMTWFISASMSSLFKNNDIVDIGNYHLNLRQLKKHNISCDSNFINDNIILPPPNKNQLIVSNIYRNLLHIITTNENYDKIEAMDYRFIRSEFVRNMEIVNSEYKAAYFIFKHTILQKEYSINLIESYKKDHENFIKNQEYEKAKVTQNLINENQDIINNSEKIILNINNFKIINRISGDFDEIPNISKYTQFANILKNIYARNPKAQCMCFSNYDFIYTLIKKFLMENNITFKELDGGNVKNMDNIINSFKNKEFSVLLADSSMYSAGMNLENITDIIFIHNMEEIKEKQVIGRAHRYGREGILQIWYINYE